MWGRITLGLFLVMKMKSLKCVFSPIALETFNNKNIGKIKQKAKRVKISSCKEGEGSVYLL